VAQKTLPVVVEAVNIYVYLVDPVDLAVVEVKIMPLVDLVMLEVILPQKEVMEEDLQVVV
jgi:hypothetical protein|tara:strand:- start:272 stop:451 length:180 start_codon:yes stop_codon:yes gene_type:complete